MKKRRNMGDWRKSPALIPPSCCCCRPPLPAARRCWASSSCACCAAARCAACCCSSSCWCFCSCILFTAPRRLPWPPAAAPAPPPLPLCSPSLLSLLSGTGPTSTVSCLRAFSSAALSLSPASSLNALPLRSRLMSSGAPPLLSADTMAWLCGCGDGGVGG